MRTTTHGMGVRRPFVAAFCACIAFAIAVVMPVRADVWTGRGGDNKWSTPANWSKEVVPADGENLSVSGGDFEIEIDGDVRIGQILIGSPTAAKVRIHGDGKMIRDTDATSNSSLYEGSELVLDGADWDARKSGLSVRSSATFEVRAGTYSSEGGLFLNEGGRLLISGGTLDSYRLARSVRSTLELSGGTLKYTTDNGVCTGQNGMILKGGRLASGLNLTSLENVSSAEGASLDVNGYALDDAFAWSARGTLYATNAASVFDVKQTSALGGHGTYVFKSLKVEGGSRTVLKVDAAELAVGKYDRGNSGCMLEAYNDTKLSTFGYDGNVIAGFNIGWHGLLTVSTSDYYSPAVARAWTFGKPYPTTAVGLRVLGCGSLTYEFPNVEALTVRQYDCIEVGPGATLTLDGGTFNNANISVKTGRLKLCAGSRLVIKGVCLNVRTVTTVAEIDPTASIEYYFTGTPAELLRYPVVDLGPGGDASAVTITTPNGLPAGWRIVRDGSVAYLTDDKSVANPDSETESVWTWIGAADGNWTPPANWAINKNNKERNKYPGANQTIVFAGLGTTVITNNLGGVLAFNKMQFKKGAAVVRFRGEPFEMTATAVSGASMAVKMDTPDRTAVVFENRVRSTSTTYHSSAAGVGSISYLCGFTGESAIFNVIGDNRLGGESEFMALNVGGIYTTDSTSGSNPSLALITNAVVTVTAQTNDLAYSGNFSLRVEAGAKLQFANSGNRSDVRYRPTFAFANTTIHGLLDIGIPFYVVGDQKFYGRGAIAVDCVRGDVTGSGRVCIGDGLSLYSTGFDTVSAENPDSAVSVLAESDAAIGATCDWTYGPAAGVTTATTAADRALRSAGVYATLTVDTEDPGTGAGHRITFADPILAAGDLVKAGAGTLVFETTGNTVAERFTVEEGTLALGPSLAANADWTDVLTAKEIVLSDGCMADGFKMKIVVNDDGTATLQMKPKRGLVLLVR